MLTSPPCVSEAVRREKRHKEDHYDPFRLNGTEQNLDVDSSMPLLWAIRENLGPRVQSLAVARLSAVPARFTDGAAIGPV